MTPQRTPHPAYSWVRAASAVFGLGIAARFLLLTAVESAILSANLKILPRTRVEHAVLRLRDYAPWESFWVYAAGLVVSAALTGLMVFAVRRSWAACPAATLRGGAVAVVLLSALTAANAKRHQVYFEWFNRAPATPQNFPFDANTVYTRAHNDHVTHAVIGPDGRRRCTDQPLDGQRTRITMVGDSFVFGLYVGEEHSPCWMLHADLEARAPGTYAMHNTAKPGASVHTYVKMMDFTMEHHGTDAFIVGLVIPNDSEPVGPLSYRWLPRSRLFQLASTVLHPDTVLAAMLWHQKVGRSEGFEYVSLVAGLRRISAAAARHRRPTMLYIYDNPGQSHTRQSTHIAYLVEMLRLASKNPYLHITEDVLATPLNQPTEKYHIVGDGHPNAAGHQHHHKTLLPAVEAFIEEFEL